MSRCAPAAILCLVLSFSRTPAAFAQRPPVRRDTGGVLGGLSIASFTGTNQDSIQAVATDASGNIYVAGTTSSAQFPVKNAEQPAFGDARILRTNNLGATWTASGNPPADVTVLVADPVSPQVLFSGGSNGIYKSTDAGQTWRVVDSFPVEYPAGFGMAIDPGNRLRLAALTPSAGLIRSLDGGETWMPGGKPTCQITPCNGELVADPTGSGALLLNGIGVMGVSISRDWGLTFQALSPPALGMPGTAAFDPSNPGWIYADVSVGVMGTLWLSTDYGSTWTAKASPSTAFSGIMSLAVDPDQPDTLVAALAQGLYKSSDGAASWTFQGSNFLPDAFSPLVMVPHSCNPQGGLFATGDGVPGTSSVAFSPDLGVTWMTPQLTNVTSVAAGTGCTFYVTRMTSGSSDAFVAKIASDGGLEWATYLGGSDKDTAVALAVDQQGNVYVAGNTSSPDFPTSVAHIGPQGENFGIYNEVLARWPGYLFGNARRRVHKHCNRARRRRRPGRVYRRQDQFVAVSGDSWRYRYELGTGFFHRLSGEALFGRRPWRIRPVSAISSRIQARFWWARTEKPLSRARARSGFRRRLPIHRSCHESQWPASQLLSATYLPGLPLNITGLAADAQNNLVVLAEAARRNHSPGHAGSLRVANGPSLLSGVLGPPSGDAFVTKLRASDWQPVYTAVFAAPCGIQTGAVSIDPSGSAVLAMAVGAGLPLRSPLLAGPVCGENSSVIAKLSADGSTLQFATYLDNCGIPGIAVVSDRSIYAGVSPAQGGDTTSVLHLTNLNPAQISLDQISNAFSGDASVVVGGGLYTLTTSGFQPSAANLGINPSQNLPFELSGVQVNFVRRPGGYSFDCARTNYRVRAAGFVPIGPQVWRCREGLRPDFRAALL